MIDPSAPYLTGLAQHEATVKPALDGLISRLEIQVVGDGYIDAITRSERVDEFINELTQLGVAVTLVTLWCDCTSENTRKFGCPHGYGGPRHANGYFSEISEDDSFEVDNSGIVAPDVGPETDKFVTSSNQLAHVYITEGMKARVDYSPCFLPGLWLGVPEQWKSDS